MEVQGRDGTWVGGGEREPRGSGGEEGVVEATRGEREGQEVARVAQVSRDESKSVVWQREKEIRSIRHGRLSLSMSMSMSMCACVQHTERRCVCVCCI